uniref:Uncharacterized protein n=1 Tax=Noccaea caerulescens TaxID=107243 RepID=A0A1J3HHR0_NOCCA
MDLKTPHQVIAGIEFGHIRHVNVEDVLGRVNGFSSGSHCKRKREELQKKMRKKTEEEGEGEEMKTREKEKNRVSNSALIPCKGYM